MRADDKLRRRTRYSRRLFFDDNLGELGRQARRDILPVRKSLAQMHFRRILSLMPANQNNRSSPNGLFPNELLTMCPQTVRHGGCNSRVRHIGRQTGPRRSRRPRRFSGRTSSSGVPFSQPKFSQLGRRQPVAPANNGRKLSARDAHQVVRRPPGSGRLCFGRLTATFCQPPQEQPPSHGPGASMAVSKPANDPV